MTEEQIRKIVRDESESVFDKKIKNVQFENYKTPRHEHNGKDAPRVSQEDIIPGDATSGKIEFATSGRRYKIKLTFNPTQVLFNGVAATTAGNTVAMVVGCARLSKKGYYLQPDTPDSVRPGTPFPVVQNSTCIWGGAFESAPASEGHIARAQRAGVIYASLTIPGGGFNENNFSESTQRDKPYENGVLYLDFYCAQDWYLLGNLTIS